MLLRASALSACTAVSALGAVPAVAQGQPVTASRSQAQAVLGYGISETGRDAREAYGLAAALQGSYTFESAVNVGGRLQHFFGSRQSREDETAIELADLLAGYDVAVASTLVLRPALGLGATSVVNPHTDVGSSYVFFHVAPDLSLIQLLGPLAVVIDVRYSLPNTRVYLEPALILGLGIGTWL
jgi:hypothetical protein